MKTIEIIVHCWAERRPVFASMLTAQLSSLVIWRPRCRVKITVFTSAGDRRTADVLRGFGAAHEQPAHSVWVSSWTLPLPQLLRRAIGRNLAAKASTADVVWFGDCDYLFGDGCLDKLAEHEWKAGLGFPLGAYIHKDHATGDAEMGHVVPGQVWEPDLSLFVPWKARGAIGGLQIAPGDVARRGYCDGTKWQNEVRADDFQDTREDRAYRGSVPGPHDRIHLPNLYRIRHSDSAFESVEQRVPKKPGA
jgi:hypothetical protein